jgi:hypothetical protein
MHSTFQIDVVGMCALICRKGIRVIFRQCSNAAVAQSGVETPVRFPQYENVKILSR